MPGMAIAVGTSRRSRAGAFGRFRRRGHVVCPLLVRPLVIVRARASKIGAARDDEDLELTAP
jgi:hypothetical protein